MNDNRQQVEQQCRAVAHLGKAISSVHADLSRLVAEGGYGRGSMLDDLGRRTAAFMEELGEMLNAMGAHDPDEDAWLDPIFAEAQRLYPVRSDEATGVTD